MYIVFTLQKSKNEGKNLKENQRKKTPFYRGTRIKITLNISSEIMQARRVWSKIFEVL